MAQRTFAGIDLSVEAVPDATTEEAYNDGDNAKTVITDYPNGSPQTTDWFVPPPGGITCDVDADGGINNVSPATLDLFGEGGDEKEGDCTTTTTVNESGPNGSE